MSFVVAPCCMCVLLFVLRNVVLRAWLAAEPQPGGPLDTLLVGVAAVSCLPPPISSGLVVTRMAGGTAAIAVFNASLGAVLSIFVSPVLMLLFLPGHAGASAADDDDDVDDAESGSSSSSLSMFTSIVRRLVLTSLLPMLLGQILQWHLIKRRRANRRNADGRILNVITLHSVDNADEDVVVATGTRLDTPTSSSSSPSSSCASPASMAAKRQRRRTSSSSSTVVAAITEELPFASFNSTLSLVSRAIMLLVIYALFCDTFLHPIPVAYTDVGILIVVMGSFQCGFFCLAFLLTSRVAWLGLRAPRRRRDAIATLYASSFKSLAIGINLLNAVWRNDVRQGVLSVPVMLMQPMELVLGMLVAPRLKAWAARGEADAAAAADNKAQAAAVQQQQQQQLELMPRCDFEHKDI
jgi:predicted Na+-dependent transporter